MEKEPVRQKLGNMHPANPAPVVSVRLDRDLVNLLDRLVQRTGRSRGFYLREALRRHLPGLAEEYWAHDTTEKAHAAERRQFDLLISQLIEHEHPRPGGPLGRDAPGTPA